MKNICDICGLPFEASEIANNGGCAIAMTFCYGTTTNMQNKAYCSDCTKEYVLPIMRRVRDEMFLDIWGLDDATN